MVTDDYCEGDGDDDDDEDDDDDPECGRIWNSSVKSRNELEDFIIVYFVSVFKKNFLR